MERADTPIVGLLRPVHVTSVFTMSVLAESTNRPSLLARKPIMSDSARNRSTIMRNFASGGNNMCTWTEM